MKTCIDKTCEAVLCEECNDLKPSMCGDRGLQFPKDACDVITFEGVEDVETKQGLCVDLTEGVHAYDGDGTEISYTVEPSEIGCCDVGEHEVTYTAVGKGNKMLPSFCLGKPVLTTADCGLMTKVVTRVITILQSLPPKIIGAVRTVIPVGTTFDPLEGVSGIDDNGKETEVTFEGRYDLSTGKQSIASFESDIEQPAKSLKVELEPIQDLNGYDKPWSAGAGKNKFDVDAWIALGRNNAYYSVSDSAVSVIADDVGGIGGRTIQLKPSTQYVISFTNASDCRIFSDTAVTLAQISGQTSTSFTTTDSGQIAIKFYGTTYPTVIGKVQIEEGSTATAWTPYSNICPIEGWTEADTHRTGVNVWDEEWEVGNIDFSNGQPISATDRIRSKNFNPCLPNTMYYIKEPTTTKNVRIAYYDASKSYVGESGWSGNQLRTTPSNAFYFKLACGSAYGTTYKNDISINYPSTDTEYHPYDGETYHTDLGRTVYGGVLDVVTGKMTIEWAMREFDGSRDEAWSFREGANRNRVVLPDVDERTGSYNTDILGNYITATDGADSNPQVWKANINALGNLLVGIPSSIGNISKWVEYLSQNPLQIAYKLASPQTIRLGKQTIALLQGQNNVWSEDGKVEVVYSKPISGETQFDTEGVYTIYYHTEDECGNETTVKRYLIVGECNTEQAEPVLCKGKICCATLDCSENYLVVCDGTVCDGRVGCSSSEPTICNGKICSAKLSCTQTEITPIEAEV